MSMGDELPSAADNMKKIALAEAEKASAYMRKQAAAEAEKRDLLERFEKPSGVSDEERLKRAGAIIRRAVDNGLTEVFIGRFPNALFTDRGRAINQMEPGWETTMTGLPKELFHSGSGISNRAATGYAARSSTGPAGCPGTSA